MKIAGIVVISLFVLLAASYWSYLQGLSRNDAFEAVKLMAFTQYQQKCVETSDDNCLKKTQRILMHIVAGELQRSDLGSLSEADRIKVDAFLKEDEALGH